jgi:hypothetical protein
MAAVDVVRLPYRGRVVQLVRVFLSDEPHLVRLQAFEELVKSNLKLSLASFNSALGKVSPPSELDRKAGSAEAAWLRAASVVKPRAMVWHLSERAPVGRR